MFKVRVSLFCLFPLLILSIAAIAQNVEDFDSVPPQRLFDQAWQTTGVQEKLAVRAYLAAKFPDTEFGMFSHAWLVDHDGDQKAATVLYNQCMDRYPRFLNCLSNAVGLLTDPRQQLEMAQRGMAIDPAFDDFALIRRIYFIYAEGLKDKKAADDFLSKWETRYPDSFMFPFIRGLYSEFDDKGYDKAESFYTAAAAKAPNRYELATRLAGVRLKRAEAQSAGDAEKAEALTPALRFVKDHAQSDPLEAYNALMYVAGVYKDDFKSHTSEFYLLAFKLRHTDDAVSEAGNLLMFQSKSVTRQFVEQAKDVMPHSPAVLKLLGYLTDDLKEAQSYYEEAVARAGSPGERVDTSILMAQRLFEDRLLDYDHAHQILKGLLQQPLKLAKVYNAIFNDRLEAADFPAAKQYLDQYETLRRREGNINENFFRQYNVLLSYYLNNEREAQRYYERNPFLLYWQKQFGESLRTSINFATDSDVIPSSDLSKLDNLARLLTDKGADHYIFAIEGHTDNTGPDSVNIPLSRRRAEAIARYLKTVKHIAPEQLQTAGYGSLHPIAPNATEQGKAHNRRVEILPVGNLTSPQIVATAALPQSGEGETQNSEDDPGLNAKPEISSSPDGRYLAVGRDPMELWDAETGVRVKQFGFAGTRRFSPNGRYIASLSEYKFPGNIVRKTLFVDDVKTGLRVVQQPLFYSANTLAWDPFSSRIVYLNDYGQVCIYSLPQHRRTACMETGGTLITGQVLWTHDGRYILSGQAQAREIQVWDADTLKLVRTLDGINWPHALAETSDGRYIVCTDNQRVITVWDLHNNWEVRQQKIPNLTSQIVPHPDKPLVMLGDFGGGAHQHGTLFDVARMQVVASLEEGPEGAEYAFGEDGRKLFRSRPDEISLLDAATLQQTGALTGTAVSARGGFADTRNDRYVTFDDAGVNVWDIRTGRRVHYWPQVVQQMTHLADDQLLAAYPDRKANQTRLWILNTSTLSVSELQPLNFRVDHMTVKNNLAVFGGTAFTFSNGGEENGIVETYDQKSWQRRGQLQIPLVTETLEYGSIAGSRIDSLDVAPDGSAVAVVSAWMDGFGHPYTISKDVRVFETSSGNVADRHGFTSNINGVAFPDKDHVEVTTGNGTWSVNRKSDERAQAGDQVGGENVLSLRNGGRIVWSRVSIRKLQGGNTLTLNTNNVVNVEAFEDRNLVVALSGSNEISFYDLADLSKVITVISKRNGEWIAYTPGSEFSASPEGTDKVSWSLGDRLLDFKALKSRFERPALLADRLQQLATRESEPAADKTSGGETGKNH